MAAAIYAKQVPEHLVNILDTWRQKQIPILNRQQAVIHVLNEWVIQHKQEFVKEGIITHEQLSLFTSGG
jgi:hypothetical protein